MSRFSSAAKMAYRNVSHVIFDMDGLLLDTEGIYKRVVADIAKSFGKKYPLEVRLKVLGRTEQDTFKIAVKDLKLPITTEEFAHEYRKLLITKLPTAPLMPGAENLVRHLHKNNIPIAVATSSSQDTVELKTRKHKEIFSLFNHIVMGSSDPDVKHGKPAPDIFLVTAARFPDKPSPEKCLVFEDAPNGVDGAVAAGMQCVMVPDPHVTPELREKATLLLESLIEFKPQDFGLPAF